MEHQFIIDECERMANVNFEKNKILGTSDNTLFNAQLNHMLIVLERVLKTTDGLTISRKRYDNPRYLWRLHKQHLTKSANSARIMTNLSQELAQMKIAKFPTTTKCLDTFDTKLEKFNELSKDTIPPSLAIRFLRPAINGNTQLLNAWAFCDTITERLTAGATPTYKDYFNFLMSHTKHPLIELKYKCR